MADSLRLQILETVREVYKSAVIDDANGRFSLVEIGPLADQDQRRRYSLGIVPGVERKTYQFPFQMCFLPMATEFRITVNQGEPKSGIMAERLMTNVQTIMYENSKLNGLAIDTKEVGNEVDMTTYGDRSVYGVVYWEVQYRHAHSDVTSREGTV